MKRSNALFRSFRKTSVLYYVFILFFRVKELTLSFHDCIVTLGDRIQRGR